jgi:hypothetical protein
MGGEQVTNEPTRDDRPGIIVRLVVALVILIIVSVAVGALIDPHLPKANSEADLRDFYNDVAAICIVVLFAKFVAHGRRAKEDHINWTILHGACVLLAGVGVFAALRGAEGGKSGDWYDLAWIAAGLSMSILVVDVLWFDLRPLGKRLRGPSRTS